MLDPSSDGVLRGNVRRAAFYARAVASLAREVAGRGSSLVVRRGPLERTVLALVREAGAGAVTWSAAYDAASMRRDRSLQSALEEAGVRATIVHDAPAVPPDETAAARSADEGRGYRALGPYVTAWTAQTRSPHAVRATFAPHAIASEALPDASAPEAFPANPSEAATLAHLTQFLRAPVLGYATGRNVPAHATSRLSAALSFGTISARTVLAAVDERGADRFLLTEERLSLQAFTRALARRDFFLQLGWFFEDAPDAALQARMRDFSFAKSHPLFDAWRTGRTGYPLIDAGVAELRTTGWMHPRVRSVAASFLCFDLGVDWRLGRDAWNLELIEDEPALATGNWQWVAGVGADLAQFPRIYNPRRQLRTFDPAGRYVRRWLPELAHASDAELFDPQPVVERGQLRLPLYAATGYPAPVLDHDAAARAALRRYAAYARPAATP